MYNSTDGKHWVLQQKVVTLQLNDIAFGTTNNGNTDIVVGNGGVILNSHN